MKDSILKKNFWEISWLLADINNKEDMYNFMRDLCTKDELEEFILRRQIAKALYTWNSYVEIQNETGASSTTVARVAKFLNWKHGGYKKVLDKRT